MAARSHKRPRTAGARAPWMAFALWGLGVLVVAGLMVAADRAWVARTRLDPSDPAIRVAGAVRSISGSGSVRRAVFDPSTRGVRVEATSRYYDSSRTAQENREYLATEGRLAAQLALHDNRVVGQVTIALYARRTSRAAVLARQTLLATVTARQGQAFQEMKVEYGGPLAAP